MTAVLRIAGTRWFRVCSSLLGIAIPLVWLLTVVTPGHEAVKVRNALVAHVGQPADFTWTPDAVPATFLTNRGPVPARFERTATLLSATNGDVPLMGLELALSISSHLMSAPMRVGGPVQSSVEVAYEAITRRGGGYCADFTQVFAGIAVAAGLPVRTWSISFEGFGAGHAFSEVFDERLGKWVLVDSFHSLYFVDPATREPLSVLEVHDRLLAFGGSAAPMEIQRIVPDRFPFRSEAMALDYYRRGMTQLALSWGTNVFDYDRSRPVRWSAAVSRHLERLVAILVGQYPEMRIYPRGVSLRDVDQLTRTRNRFLLATGALTLALLTFGWQIAGACLRERPAAR